MGIADLSIWSYLYLFYGIALGMKIRYVGRGSEHLFNVYMHYQLV